MAKILEPPCRPLKPLKAKQFDSALVLFHELVIIHDNHRANLKGPKVSIQDHACRV
jgi:hypothetical protein